jgi:hypothetical protein
VKSVFISEKIGANYKNRATRIPRNKSPDPVSEPRTAAPVNLVGATWVEEEGMIVKSVAVAFAGIEKLDWEDSDWVGAWLEWVAGIVDCVATGGMEEGIEVGVWLGFAVGNVCCTPMGGMEVGVEIGVLGWVDSGQVVVYSVMTSVVTWPSPLEQFVIEDAQEVMV